ncbi:MAG: sulfate adenylyltransferase subunit CysN, partial [Methylococcales bacterium]|nr:sulfate adenylyltransferase subunit CysN [Methylococcales bacterium]
GDILMGEGSQPMVADSFKATLVWMTEKAMVAGRQYVIKLATSTVSGSVSTLHHRIDVNTLEHHEAEQLELNEIGSCSISVNAPVVFDAYEQIKGTGAFIIIDRLNNVTVGAGMITGTTDFSDLKSVSPAERAARFSQQAITIALTGKEADKMATQLERQLFDNGHAATILETTNTDVIDVIKQAGLIGLCVNTEAETDINFNCDNQTLDTIYTTLKQQSFIY